MANSIVMSGNHGLVEGGQNFRRDTKFVPVSSVLVYYHREAVSCSVDQVGTRNTIGIDRVDQLTSTERYSA